MMNINLDDIQVHADVIDSAGQPIGKVDQLQGSDQIKLTKNETIDGKHHLIPVAWVKEVVNNRVLLTKVLMKLKHNGRLCKNHF